MEHRRRATEVAIHRAAVELIGEHGYDAVTVNMISDRAGVSVRTFFNYFPTKEAAVVLPYAPFDPALSDVVRTGPGADRLFADLADLTVNNLETYNEGAVGPETLLPMIHEAPELLQRHTSELALVETQIGELIAQRLGLPGDDRRVEIIATAVIASAKTAIRRWSRDPGGGELADEVRSCMRLLEPLRSLAMAQEHDPPGKS